MNKQPCEHPSDQSEAVSAQRRQGNGTYRNISIGRYCWKCRTFFVHANVAPKGTATA